MILRANSSQIPLADNSVHCVVTSPPYWGLRRYQGQQDTLWPDGTRCAYGLDPTIEQYVDHSLVILREVRRVLRDDGTCWWNLGDSYSSYRDSKAFPDSLRNGNGTAVEEGANNRNPSLLRKSGLKHLDLCLIPERVALAAQADGWYVRSLVIWAKPNPMPESVNGWRWERHRVKVKPRGYRPEPIEAGQPSNVEDRTDQAQWTDCPGCEKCSPNDGLVLRKGSWRPTDAYEHILMLAKTADYFGDAEAVKEASSYPGDARHLRFDASKETEYGVPAGGSRARTGNPTGQTRNLRNVWTFPTQPYPEAHFATFPERLPEICIKASTSERGCCPRCGANWVRVIERKPMVINRSDWADLSGNRTATSGTMVKPAESSTLGWRPSCACNAGEPVPCTVLDPFGGSGTTARVAINLNRRAVSIDLEYHGLAKKRTTVLQPVLLAV